MVTGGRDLAYDIAPYRSLPPRSPVPGSPEIIPPGAITSEAEDISSLHQHPRRFQFIPYTDLAPVVTIYPDTLRPRLAAVGISLSTALALLLFVLAALVWSQTAQAKYLGSMVGWAATEPAGQPNRQPAGVPGPTLPAVAATAVPVVAVISTATPPPALNPTAIPRVPEPTPVATSAALAPRFTPTPRPPASHPMPTPLPPALVLVRLPARSPPTRLQIPRLGLDAQVETVGVKTVQRDGDPVAMWDTAPDLPSFHQTSAYPGSGGNTVINGHRDLHGAVFLQLPRVQVGDELILSVGDTAYLYRVRQKRKVRYEDASPEEEARHQRLLGNTDGERLTLVTCTPIGLATHRLYIIAEPPDELPVLENSGFE